MERILLVGAGAREHAIGRAVAKSDDAELFTVAHNYNLGLERLSSKVDFAIKETAVSSIATWAHDNGATLAVAGLEDCLEAGLTDALATVGIPTVGPTQAAARVESSKLFTRRLMEQYNIPAQVEFRYFDESDEAEAFLRSTGRSYALKPVGLTAGQGVRVMGGEQLPTEDDAVAYARRVIESRIGGVAGIVIEELLVGPEFTLQCFVDGVTVVPMPLVRDYKRAYNGDHGPNTGSMGSYSMPDGLLPFVTAQDREFAIAVLTRVTDALRSEGTPYKGIMYGQFIMTRQGPKLVEINARFGDPEAINVLPLLETDFVQICKAIVQGRLQEVEIKFSPEATVCRYITPLGYPGDPRTGQEIRFDEALVATSGAELFFAKLDRDPSGRLVTTRSRSIGLLGRGSSPAEAVSSIERAKRGILGVYHMRTDIGTELDRPVEHSLLSAAV